MSQIIICGNLQGIRKWYLIDLIDLQFLTIGKWNQSILFRLSFNAKTIYVLFYDLVNILITNNSHKFTIVAHNWRVSFILSTYYNKYRKYIMFYSNQC